MVKKGKRNIHVLVNIYKMTRLM